MKHLNVQYFSVQLACAALFFAFASGCAQASPENTRQSDDFIHTTEPEKIQITHRKSYISPEIRRRFLVGAALHEMRHPAEPLSRPFYIEPDEKGASFSIGDTRDGYLVNGKSLPAPSLLLRQLPVQYERGIAYGTTEVVELLVDTARVMEKKYPDTIMHLGNMGLREGGDIPYSISHNAGRDADIAFYLKNPDGSFAHPVNLHKIDRRFKSVEPGSNYTFDIEKNTTLFEVLLNHPRIHVQFVFLAKHLRRAIYNELVSRGSSPEMLQRFEQTVQNQAAHNDHYHIRIYCSDSDICAGCVDKSVIHPWHEDPVPKRAKCIERHAANIASKRISADKKAASLQRLALLGAAEGHERDILKNLRHDDENVRAAAALAARSVGSSAAGELIGVYAAESSAAVRLEILRTLTTFRSEQARAVFHRELEQASDLSNESAALICNYIVHYPDSSDVRPLIDAWEKMPEDAPIREAYEVVTNTQPCADSREACIEAARSWYAENADKPRKQWLIDGFNAAGFSVKNLENADIPHLLDAIDGSRGISVNAQLRLREIGHFHQDSLGWSIKDARWHYTRYFKRRAKRFKIDLSDRDERGSRFSDHTEPPK